MPFFGLRDHECLRCDDCTLVSGSHPISRRITNNHSVQEARLTICLVQHILWDFQLEFLCPFIGSCATNFLDTVGMQCTKPMLIPQLDGKFSDGDTMVKWFCRPKFAIGQWPCHFNLLRVYWMSADMWPSVKWLYHKLIDVILMASSLQACWVHCDISKVFWQQGVVICHRATWIWDLILWLLLCSNVCIILIESTTLSTILSVYPILIESTTLSTILFSLFLTFSLNLSPDSSHSLPNSHWVYLLIQSIP